MFDILLSFVAIANLGVEIIGAKESIKGTGAYTTTSTPSLELSEAEKEKLERRRLLEEADKAYKKTNRINHSQKKVYSRNELFEEMNISTEAEIDTLADWIMKHDDIIIDVLEPGKHLISYKDLGGVNKDELADFLFMQSKVESVEKIPEGIEITTR